MRWVILAMAVLGGSASAGAMPAPIKQQVSFTDVLDLTAGVPSAVLRYGPQALQFGQLWLPDSGEPSVGGGGAGA